MTLTTNRRESGFTLVELLIVVLIIGILATIAIPIFNGQRDKARNAVAQSTARNALSAAKAYFTQKESYAGLDAAGLKAIENTLVVAGTPTPVAGKSGTQNPQAVFTYDFVADGAAAAPAGQAAGTSAGVTICTASEGDNVYCVRSNGASDKYSSGATFPDATTGTGTFGARW